MLCPCIRRAAVRCCIVFPFSHHHRHFKRLSTKDQDTTQSNCDLSKGPSRITTANNPKPTHLHQQSSTNPTPSYSTKAYSPSYHTQHSKNDVYPNPNNNFHTPNTHDLQLQHRAQNPKCATPLISTPLAIQPTLQLLQLAPLLAQHRPFHHINHIDYQQQEPQQRKGPQFRRARTAD